jgi:hypothetical protein
VDGKPVDVLRCNYLCLGVPVGPGEHKVVLSYSPSVSHIWIQGFGMFLCLCTVVFLSIRRLCSKKESRDVRAR